MTKEEKFVVNPLVKYFKNYSRSRANWNITDRPQYGTSATGWDLQMERKNEVLLIEAKYIQGPFASALAGLTIAPLVNRPEKMKRNLYRSWSATVCWAIGCGYERTYKYKMNGVYQILFDCIARNIKFWEHYSKLLNVKYIFFVDNQRVAKINFNKMITLSKRYRLSINKTLEERRTESEKLLGDLKFV